MLWPQRSPREVPVSIAMAIARDINALIAPHLPYGLTLTDILGQYPGSLYIPPDVFWSYLRAALVGPVHNRFRDICDPQRSGPQVWILQELATEISAISRKYAGRELGGSWRTASLVNFSGNTAGPRLTRRLPWCKRPNQCRFTGSFQRPAHGDRVSLAMGGLLPRFLPQLSSTRRDWGSPKR